MSRGGYILSEAQGKPRFILMASGSEVGIILDAQAQLHELGIAARVVSMPSLELFAQQSRAYQEEVLPPAMRLRIAVEAAHPQPWFRWVGDAGEIIGLDEFGASAPYKRIFAETGLTAKHVLARARAMAAPLNPSG